MKTLSFVLLAIVALGAVFAADDFGIKLVSAMAFSLFTRLAYMAHRAERSNDVL